VSLGFAEQDKIGDLIEYVMEYERLVLKKEEFIKQADEERHIQRK
jgi:hypothetical protein